MNRSLHVIYLFRSSIRKYYYSIEERKKRENNISIHPSLFKRKWRRMLRAVHLVGRNRTVCTCIYVSGDKPYSLQMNWSGTYGHLIWSNVLSRQQRKKKKGGKESDSSDCLETTFDRIQSVGSSSSSPPGFRKWLLFFFFSFFFVEIKIGLCCIKRKRRRGASSYTNILWFFFFFFFFFIPAVYSVVDTA